MLQSLDSRSFIKTRLAKEKKRGIMKIDSSE